MKFYIIFLALISLILSKHLGRKKSKSFVFDCELHCYFNTNLGFCALRPKFLKTCGLNNYRLTCFNHRGFCEWKSGECVQIINKCLRECTINKDMFSCEKYTS